MPLDFTADSARLTKAMLKEQGLEAGTLEATIAEALAVGGGELNTKFGKQFKAINDSIAMVASVDSSGTGESPRTKTFGEDFKVDTPNPDGLDSYREDQARKLIKGDKGSAGAEVWEKLATEDTNFESKQQAVDMATSKRIEAAKWLSGENG